MRRGGFRHQYTRSLDSALNLNPARPSPHPPTTHPSLQDVEREFPGELERVLHWFRDYKKPDGKPENKFGYDSRCLNRAFALAVVEETHGFYNALRSGRRENTEGMALY